ncbi:MAG: 3D domain-containing protein [Blastocatellia bacterium]
MNQYPQSGFTKGLSSGLYILAIFAIGYCFSGNVVLADTDDNPPAASKASEDNSIEIPGTFKNLPGAKDAVTSKQSVEEFQPASINPSTRTELVIDEKKGVTSIPNKNAPVNPNKSGIVTASGEGDRADFREFHATAYCLKGRTASGATTQQGMIAADPRVLPLGTVVHIRAGQYTGTYTVTDTGSRIKGHIVDVYVPTYKEAKQFGRRQVKIRVIGRAKRGNNSSHSSTVLADIK